MNVAIEIETILDRLIAQRSLLDNLPDHSLESIALAKVYESTKAHLLFLTEQASKGRTPFSSSRKARCVQKILQLPSDDLSPLKQVVTSRAFHLRKRRLRKPALHA